MDNKLKVPNHIAIILDGNGRWAKKRNMPRGYGHIVGCDNLIFMCFFDASFQILAEQL